MDLKGYYRRIEEQMAAIDEDYVVVRSHQTQNGGRSGMLSEVSRPLAARMIVDGLASLAGKEEAESFREQLQDEVRQAEMDQLRSRVQVTVVSENEMAALKEALRTPRKKG